MQVRTVSEPCTCQLSFPSLRVCVAPNTHCTVQYCIYQPSGSGLLLHRYTPPPILSNYYPRKHISLILMTWDWWILEPNNNLCGIEDSTDVKLATCTVAVCLTALHLKRRSPIQEMLTEALAGLRLSGTSLSVPVCLCGCVHVIESV